MERPIRSAQSLKQVTPTVIDDEQYNVDHTLGDFIRAGETRIGEDIFLNSLYSGFMSGS